MLNFKRLLMIKENKTLGTVNRDFEDFPSVVVIFSEIFQGFECQFYEEALCSSSFCPSFL